jgi:hypothetical protein
MRAKTANFTCRWHAKPCADYLGLTVETVNQQITTLRDDGVISKQRYPQICIADKARLRDERGDHGSKRYAERVS